MMRTTYPAPALAAVIPTARNFIPPMTDPQGRHWGQPNLSDVDMDDTHVMLTRRQFDDLAEYSTTVPSGVYPGKCWKAEGMVWPDHHGAMGFPKRTGIWYLHWFGESERGPGFCSNHHREIIILD